MNQGAWVPPRFALAASQFLYDTDLPDHLYRTYARITGLAWQQRPGEEGRYARTPPLTVHKLATICRMSERNMWRHIDELVERGLLRCETVQAMPRRMVFYPVWPGAASQATPPSAKAPDEAKAVAASGEAPTPDPPGEAGQALAAFGVDPRQPLARQVAALPHVTPELVRAWGDSLCRRPGIQNLPGLLLHVLQQATEPPAERQPRAQALPPARPPSPPLPRSPSSSPPARGAGGLPGELRQALHDLGWSGDGAWAEVARLAAGDPPAGGEGQGLDFVWAWVRYVQDHPGLGAGFLRSRLRGSSWPPHKDGPDERRGRRDRARWRAQWPAQAAPDPPPRRSPSPRQEAMGRYGISSETMDTWARALGELALQMDRATFDARLRGSLLLAVADGRATVGVPNAYSVDWLRYRLDRVILRTLNRHLDGPVETLHVVALDGIEGRGDP